MSIFEQNLLTKAGESPSSKEERMSIDFLRSIAEVSVARSRYDKDNCYAIIKFKNGKSSSVALDYSCYAEPGDHLVVSSLRWKVIESPDGEFRCLTGRVQ